MQSLSKSTISLKQLREGGQGWVIMKSDRGVVSVNCFYSFVLSLFLEKNDGNLFSPIVRGEAEQGSIKSLKIRGP